MLPFTSPFWDAAALSFCSGKAHFYGPQMLTGLYSLGVRSVGQALWLPAVTFS